MSLFAKKNIYKPKYKKVLKLRINIFQKNKALRFKKKKWRNYVAIAKKNVRQFFRNPKKINFRYHKPKEFLKYKITKRPQKWCSYERKYENTRLAALRIRMHYGGLSKKKMKRIVREARNRFFRQTQRRKILLNKIFIDSLEKRLDTVLFRAKFVSSVRDAHQLIKHRQVKVNKLTVTYKSFIVQKGDLIEINPQPSACRRVIRSIRLSNVWPIPPKHLNINYRTMQIVFGELKHTKMSPHFIIPFKTHKVTLFYKYH